jgi:hypothetical protein
MRTNIAFSTSEANSFPCSRISSWRIESDSNEHLFSKSAPTSCLLRSGKLASLTGAMGSFHGRFETGRIIPVEMGDEFMV